MMYMVLNKKVIIGCTIVCMALALAVVATTKFLTAKVNNYVLNLSEKLSTELGHNVTMEKVTTKWDWLLLKVNITNVTVHNAKEGDLLFAASEIISTVDTLATLSAFTLKFKSLLLRNPNLVLDCNVATSNTWSQISLAAVFKILSTQKKVIVENGALRLHGEYGADLPFKNVKIDFRQSGEHNYYIVAMGKIPGKIQPEFVFAAKYYGDLENYAQSKLDFALKTSNVSLVEILKFIPNYKQNFMQGDFADLDIHGSIQNGVLDKISSDFTVEKLSLSDGTYLAGGIGHIEYTPQNHASSFSFKDLSVGNDAWFSQPIIIDAISGGLDLQQNEQQWAITGKDLTINLAELQISPLLSMQINANGIESLLLKSNLQDLGVDKAISFIPNKKIPKLAAWLKKSLVAGKVNLIHLDYKNKKINGVLGVSNAELEFSSDWPQINDIDAVISLQNDVVKVTANNATILSAPVRSLDLIYDKKVNDTLIKLHGTIDTNIENAIEYIMQSPLQHNLGKNLAKLNPVGEISLSLKLDIDLDKTEDIKTFGSIKLIDNKLMLQDWNLPIQHLRGDIDFTNDSVSSQKLQLNLLGQNATGTINTIQFPSHNLKIVLTLPLAITQLQKLLPTINLEHFSGMAQATVGIELPLDRKNINKTFSIKSDLIGVSINLPEPFNKIASSKLPLTVRYLQSGNDENIAHISLGELLDSMIFVKDGQAQGGNIALGKKLGKYTTHKNEFFIDSNKLTGVISISSERDRIEAKLERANLSTVTSDGMGNKNLMSFIKKLRAMNKLPLIQFYCDNLLLNKNTFKKVYLELLPRTYGYEIMNFSVTNDNIMLQAQGQWQMDNKAVTILSGNAYTQNFGKVLAEYGRANSMSRGSGEMNFSLKWDGDLLDFDLLKIYGSAHFDLRAGSLINVEPGLGRVIGLLSLDTIQRRLQLDFSDLLNRGFVFDKFVADLKFAPGDITSDNILITSPSTKIELLGKTKIKSKELDFTMYVTPKVGMGLPIAAAIAAGNPAVGAAIWLFDKASGSKISEIARYKYKVTGTWDTPKIDEYTTKQATK